MFIKDYKGFLNGVITKNQYLMERVGPRNTDVNKNIMSYLEDEYKLQNKDPNWNINQIYNVQITATTAMKRGGRIPAVSQDIIYLMKLFLTGSYLINHKHDLVHHHLHHLHQ